MRMIRNREHLKSNDSKRIFFMKKSAVILFLILGIFLSGCVENATTEEKGDKIVVYTSVYPLYDFAKKIGADTVQVENMVPPGVEPHDWEPSAQDILRLEKANLFIYNGAGLEHWTEDVLLTLENKDLVVTVASEGIPILQADGRSDPHIWLNPQYAKKEAENIMKALCEVNPKQTTLYEENFLAISKDFDLLDETLREVFSSTKRKDVIVAHEAFGYLCEAYGLRQIGIEGLEPNAEPSPKKMREIIEFAKEHTVTTIFFEELASAKVAEIIASEIGAATAVLHPIEGLSEEQREKGDDYFSLMRENAAALKDALG